jgi:hypothetical protein
LAVEKIEKKRLFGFGWWYTHSEKKRNYNLINFIEDMQRLDVKKIRKDLMIDWGKKIDTYNKTNIEILSRNKNIPLDTQNIISSFSKQRKSRQRTLKSIKLRKTRKSKSVKNKSRQKRQKR